MTRMPHDDAIATARPSTSTLALRYAMGLAFAHLLTALEVLAVVWSLTGQTFESTRALLTHSNVALLAAVAVLGTSVVGVGAYRHVARSVGWFASGTVPDDRQRRTAINVVRWQSVVLLAVWGVSGAIFLVANAGAGVGATMLICFAIGFGASSSVSTSLLFTQGIYRPIMAAATGDRLVGRATSVGIATRLVMMWLINSALPSATIIGLILCKANGWFIPTTASLDVPVVVLSTVSCSVCAH
jgi:adenylate cyclase